MSNHPPKPSGPFGLDPSVIAEIEKDWVRVDQMKQSDPARVDISLLYEPIKIIPTRDGGRYPQDKFEQLISRSRLIQPSVPPASGQAYNLSPLQQQPTMYQQQQRTSVNNSPKYASENKLGIKKLSLFLNVILVWLMFYPNLILT